MKQCKQPSIFKYKLTIVTLWIGVVVSSFREDSVSLQIAMPVTNMLFCKKNKCLQNCTFGMWKCEKKVKNFSMYLCSFTIANSYKPPSFPGTSEASRVVTSHDTGFQIIFHWCYCSPSGSYRSLFLGDVRRRLELKDCRFWVLYCDQNIDIKHDDIHRVISRSGLESAENCRLFQKRKAPAGIKG